MRMTFFPEGFEKAALNEFELNSELLQESQIEGGNASGESVAARQHPMTLSFGNKARRL